MVLKGVIFLVFWTVLGGCAVSGGYERYGFYDESRDRISEHRETFIDGGKISMAYAIVYWDVLPQKEEEEKPQGKTPETFFIWLRNNTSEPLVIDPNHLTLVTGKGKTISWSPLTQNTPAPLKEQTIKPMGIVSGYVVFETPDETMRSDRPGSLVYEDRDKNRVVRYLQIEEMKKYEGLSLTTEVYYYAPVYPRLYWYPYYYPYAYYPFDIDFFYIDIPHRHYYYAPPTEPQRRRFLIPSTSGTREFKGSSGLLNRLMEDETEGSSGTKKGKRRFSR